MENLLFSIRQRDLVVEALKLKAMHFDLIEYIDFMLNKLLTMLVFETEYKMRATNDANEAGIIMFCSICNKSIGLNVYNNENFLILRHFVGDDAGILLLNHLIVTESIHLKYRFTIHNTIITFTEHRNSTMYDLLAKYIGIRNPLFIPNGTMPTVGPSTHPIFEIEFGVKLWLYFFQNLLKMEQIVQTTNRNSVNKLDITYITYNV